MRSPAKQLIVIDKNTFTQVDNMPETKWMIGIDIGGTNVTVAHVDTSGVVQERLSFLSNVEGGAAAIEADIIDAVQKLRKNTDTVPIGIGVGVAGQVEIPSGTVHFAPNLHWHQVPLQDYLQKELQLPVFVLNDVRAATWGEWRYGAGRGCDDIVCLFVGTGIGGGIVCGGQLLIGSSNTAGEIGHMTIDIHGPKCSCGNQGCLESISGGWAIGKRAQEAVMKDRAAGSALLNLVNGQPHALTAQHVSQAAHEGDKLSQQIFDEVAAGLIAGATCIIHAFNPSRLIMGGGIINGMPKLIARVEEGVHRCALKAAIKNLQVLAAQLPHSDAGVIGAAAFAQYAQANF